VPCGEFMRSVRRLLAVPRVAAGASGLLAKDVILSDEVPALKTRPRVDYLGFRSP